jgi:hypothetical protein
MSEAFLKNKIGQFERRAKKRSPSMRMSGKGTKRLLAHIMKKSK